MGGIDNKVATMALKILYPSNKTVPLVNHVTKHTLAQNRARGFGLFVRLRSSH
jgi:hypothetical protein